MTVSAVIIPTGTCTTDLFIRVDHGQLLFFVGHGCKINSNSKLTFGHQIRFEGKSDTGFAGTTETSEPNSTATECPATKGFTPFRSGHLVFLFHNICCYLRALEQTKSFFYILIDLFECPYKISITDLSVI